MGLAPVSTVPCDEQALLLRQQRPLVILLALRHIDLAEAAVALWHAEKAGLCRPMVLRAAERRIEELGGTEPDKAPTLIIKAQAIDPDMKKWEEQYGKKI
jgi:hypothetical protein